MGVPTHPIMGGVPGTTKGQRDLDTRLVGGLFGKGIRLGPVDHVTSFLTTSAAQELRSIGQDSTTGGQERVGGVGWGRESKGGRWGEET